MGPSSEGNEARRILLDPEARERYADWAAVARTVVGFLRRAAAQHPDDAELLALIGDLSVRSDEFARWWAAHEVHEKTYGVKRHVHPVVGELELRYEALVLPGDPDQQLITYFALPGTPSETALRLLGTLAAEPAAAPVSDEVEAG